MCLARRLAMKSWDWRICRLERAVVRIHGKHLKLRLDKGHGERKHLAFPVLACFHVVDIGSTEVSSWSCKERHCSCCELP